MTIQRNPYVNVARNTFGVIQVYREGESVSDIVKQRLEKYKLKKNVKENISQIITISGPPKL